MKSVAPSKATSDNEAWGCSKQSEALQLQGGEIS